RAAAWSTCPASARISTRSSRRSASSRRICAPPPHGHSLPSSTPLVPASRPSPPPTSPGSTATAASPCPSQRRNHPENRSRKRQFASDRFASSADGHLHASLVFQAQNQVAHCGIRELEVRIQ